MKNILYPSISHISIRKLGTWDENSVVNSTQVQFMDEMENRKLAKALLRGFKMDMIFRFQDREMKNAGEITALFNSGHSDAAGDQTNPDELDEFSTALAKRWISLAGNNEDTRELLFCKFLNIRDEDRYRTGYGIFIIDAHENFLQVITSPSHVELRLIEGINLKKMNDCVLIFPGSEGKNPCLFFKQNQMDFKTNFFADQFLNAVPEPNIFYNTASHVNILKAYVDQELEDAPPMERIEKMNNSEEYFRTHDHFDREEYDKSIFREPDHLAAFDEFRTRFARDKDLQIVDEFEISPEAVKRNFRGIRSVIKLDRNFHIYIHGNRHNIIRGYDPERGKHFYQLYFDEES